MDVIKKLKALLALDDSCEPDLSRRRAIVGGVATLGAVATIALTDPTHSKLQHPTTFQEEWAQLVKTFVAKHYFSVIVWLEDVKTLEEEDVIFLRQFTETLNAEQRVFMWCSATRNGVGCLQKCKAVHRAIGRQVLAAFGHNGLFTPVSRSELMARMDVIRIEYTRATGRAREAQV